jgi:hypothetical protein
MFRAVLTGIILSVAASDLGAQITTFIAPPRTAAASPQMVAAADSARRDSVERVAVTNMKVWVDSAAGITIPDRVGDSIPANDPGRPVTTTFTDGSVAPATASVLPALVVAGAVILVAGAALIGHRPRG